MTEPQMVVAFRVEDIVLLTDTFGMTWVERLADTNDDVRHEAISDLCGTIRELTSGRHFRRADGRGCTCGWDGQDLLSHYVEAHRSPGDGTVIFPVAIDKFDWSRPPGRLVKTWADAGGLTDEDVAKACRISLEAYRGVVSGSEHITTDIAVRLEAGTQTFPANVWLMLERNYRAALVERARQPHH